MTTQSISNKDYAILGATALSIGAVGVVGFRNRHAFLISEENQKIAKEKLIETVVSTAQPIIFSALASVCLGLAVKIAAPIEAITNPYKLAFFSILDIPLDDPDSPSFKLYTTPALQRSHQEVERKELAEKILIILSSNQAPSVLLTGSPGVGKSSLVRSLVAHLEDSRHPTLKGVQIKPVNLAEVKLHQLKELFLQSKSSRVIIYFDEFNTIMRPDEEQLRDALKTMLEDKDARVIGCTTISPQEIDPAFLRRFTIVPVNEPDGDLLKSILSRALSKFEEHHQCDYEETSIDYCIQETQNLLGSQPAKALKVLDQAGSAAWLVSQEIKVRPKVTKEAIDRAVIIYKSTHSS